MSFKQRLEAIERLHAIHHGRLAPRGISRGGLAHGRIHFRASGVLDAGDLFSGGWIENGMGCDFGCGHTLTSLFIRIVYSAPDVKKPTNHA